MHTIGVFCGSSAGNHRSYRKAALELCTYLANKGHSLIFGGADLGLMKILADELLLRETEVIGVMPSHLIKNEIGHKGISKMHVVKNMAERKAKMINLSDAFVALPGGFGTLDEITEVLTMNQLHLISKPIGLLNTRGFFDHLLHYFDRAVEEGFLLQAHREMIAAHDEVDKLFKLLQTPETPKLDKWINQIRYE